jgi:2-polyprenyl-3-methyl-5-hydroxy-6-metoxy-1,4-benzoquinol methylase
MKMAKRSSKKVWDKVKKMMGDSELKLGRHWSYNIHNDPKRLAFVLSRYKFAVKMISTNQNILELGCSEGIGVPILSEFALKYTGVDLDGEAIRDAKRNWVADKIKFIADDFMGKTYGRYDAVVSLDVVEHIMKKNERLFFETICNNLDSDGIAIVGTPNKTSSYYASKASQIGHVNLFDADMLKNMMIKYFRKVFIFAANDEIVHTGFLPMAHYLICIGCEKKQRNGK